MGIKKVDAIWLDGSLVPWDSASEHLLAHTMHYGVGAFEGVRAYQRSDGRTHIFRLREHVERLLDSCTICTMECPFSRDAIMQACLDVVRTNKMPACYLRPLVFLGYGALDMAGNVSEWCQDQYRPAASGPFKPGVLRLLKGGSWFSQARDLRAAARQSARSSGSARACSAARSTRTAP